jgi:hypothetical protein
VDGSSDNIRYNGSFNVQRSVEMGKPIVRSSNLINIGFPLILIVDICLTQLSFDCIRLPCGRGSKESRHSESRLERPSRYHSLRENILIVDVYFLAPCSSLDQRKHCSIRWRSDQSYHPGREVSLRLTPLPHLGTFMGH